MRLSIAANGKLLDLTTPRVMGILNVTPDSFYDGGSYLHVDDALRRADSMIEAGVDIIDIGGMSTRPGAALIAPRDEIDRVEPVIQSLRARHPDLWLSIDTLHHETAAAAARAGIDIVNDISGGEHDPQMVAVIAKHKLPMIVMHMQGRPADMQVDPHYDDVVLEVATHLRNKVSLLRKSGLMDIIIDPGFGFGKSIAHNYRLLSKLDSLRWIGAPILAGVSRKSMIYKVLDLSPEEALNGSTALHMAALDRGANILRVHDVAEARECITLWTELTRQ